MLYLIGHTKGGVGKTTIATNLASLIAPLRRVCIVDADGQGHSNRWCGRRLALAPEAPRIDCHVLDGSLHKPLLALVGRYEDILVDAGGTDSQELRSALRTVDVCLAPFSAMQNDLDGFDDLRGLVDAASEYHPPLRVFAVPNKVETNAQRRDRLPAAVDFVRGKGFEVLTTHLSMLAAPYGRSSEQGRGVGELYEARAAVELMAVLGEVQARMRQVAA